MWHFYQKSRKYCRRRLWMVPNNYSLQDPEISWDYNSGYKGDADPSPRAPSGEFDSQNSHGTRCAGEIAMIPNNQVCGVGVAYGAKIGAVRMLDGRIDDRVEGLSLQHAIDK
jgi:proprotein convertase subtilisin/kexin type 1